MWSAFHKRQLSSSQIILFGFALVILIGALVLMLPASSKAGTVTPFLDSLFTSTSAVCVTGLVVYDTATHWSVFGQSVILLLIQIGGMGVITAAAAITMAVCNLSQAKLVRRFGSTAVSVNQTAGTEFGAAEPAGHCDYGIGQTAALQYCQNRSSGGAGWFPVIGTTGNILIRAESEGVNDMTAVVITALALFPQLFGFGNR